MKKQPCNLGAMTQEDGFDELAALRFLRSRGYEVKKRTRYLKKTFEVEDSVYTAFRNCQEALGIRVKDAVNTALVEWLENHSEK